MDFAAYVIKALQLGVNNEKHDAVATLRKGIELHHNLANFDRNPNHQNELNTLTQVLNDLNPTQKESILGKAQSVFTDLLPEGESFEGSSRDEWLDRPGKIRKLLRGINLPPPNPTRQPIFQRSPHFDVMMILLIIALVLTPILNDQHTIQIQETRVRVETEIAQTQVAMETMIPDAYDFGQIDTPTNDDWQPSIANMEGASMALAPVGCFSMGETETDQQCFPAPFWIDQNPVTQAQWAQVMGEPAPSTGNPVTVSWTQALNFCQRRGMRLPTEREWEYAARGVEGWLYPWGDQAVNGSGDPASWIGAIGLFGGLPEWTSTIYNLEQFPAPYQGNDGREDLTVNALARVIRGGSTGNAATRMGSPIGVTDGISFRCARS